VASTNVAVIADCVRCVVEARWVVEACCVVGSERTRRDSTHTSAMTATTEAADTTVRAASSGITADSRLTTGRQAVTSETPVPALSSWSKTCGPAHRCNDTNTAMDDTMSAITLRTRGFRARERQDQRIASPTMP